MADRNLRENTDVEKLLSSKSIEKIIFISDRPFGLRDSVYIKCHVVNLPRKLQNSMIICYRVMMT